MVLRETKKNEQPELTPERQGRDFAFGRLNYILLLCSVGLLLIGFILMVGGGSTDPNVFSYNLFSFQRLTLSPILIITGFVVGLFAIMMKPKD
ncbi:MAG TPA: DUF3098 domain-containing protein [Bacteroidales bacterium]|nr:MAG: hypothetical protein A2X11_03110 [Bacteroidetes bacterium GWE2_42_24]OFY30444.1 MAG: hypothetical protein A2X09_12735 [Bacteroidetes bacterium GWF2_43_11]PKP17146.1 MAG: DUF3098 domain-containing protein [Bacteroidetes bacterium HGW-Bacteroidetes-22]HAQ65909.1 DUF3098 domain-containing protein [Bacteroidales bacterium]HBZ65312.1 DUF3098 domain-containing protein [Bacteroidales bacterium]